MSLRKHLQGLSLISHSPSLLYRVRQYFQLDPGPLSVALRRKNLCQADVVLCLMRIGTERARRIVECLIGRSITVGPACKFLWRINGGKPTVGRQPFITWVRKRIPHVRKSRISACICEFRVGRTREQLLLRGVTRGDIRRAVRKGWIRMAGA